MVHAQRNSVAKLTNLNTMQSTLLTSGLGRQGGGGAKPLADLGRGRTALGLLEGRNVQPLELGIEFVNGGLAELGDRNNAAMEEQPTVLTTDAGHTGQIRQGNPLADMVQRDFELTGQGGSASGRASLAQEISGGVDADLVQGLTFWWAQAGELRDRPTLGRAGGWLARRRHGLGAADATAEIVS